MRHFHVNSRDKDVVINMDTTYWGRHFRLMIQIVRRHLTAKPDLEAYVELLAIVHSLRRITELVFREAISLWHENGWIPFPREV